MDPRKIKIASYTYALPEERIAAFPLAERDASKLLIYDTGKIKEDIYRNLHNHLPGGSLVLLNDTRVIEARLLFKKPTGGVIEIFCLEPANGTDITTALSQQGPAVWKCLIGGASKWKHGQLPEKIIHTDSGEKKITARLTGRLADSFIVEFSWDDPQLDFATVLHDAGAIPLPPYIKRAADHTDRERYQTIFAQDKGSVAAPTAGLHFTGTIFERLREKNIQTEFITLHVGAGTFKPVKSEIIGDHEMHSEYFSISRAAIEKILQNIDGTIVAVGTTTLRTIESLYWMGVKIISGSDDLALTQWEAYELDSKKISAPDALGSVLEYMRRQNLDRFITSTSILIAPPYRARIASALITNFHQPQSTLLLLVAAMAGDNWRMIYDYALAHEFRMLSYGDGCLVWIKK